MRTSRLVSLSTLAAIAAAFAVAPGAQAADDYFLRVDGVSGETAVGAAKDAIQIKSFEWGAENKTTIGSASGGTGAGKLELDQLTIEKSVDSTTPQLFQRLAAGTTINSIELVARRATAAGAGAPPAIYMRYCMQPGFVASQTQKAANGDNGINETVVFRFGAVSQTYTRPNQTGPSANVFSSWNTMTNVAAMTLPNGTNACANSRF